ncbi:MetQ/NlpA family ABC transporter substrate-binding protein [Paenibacillus tuaregi]|uniref:MetQ/NlpA family ABC transporter substrate-binding protein n=1 Tax=Paenibacillus tuaregi TaxID=1816681 RepID=UPI00083806A0|nr:MetQ/NlpA family ABC transporter substrate-binding protein [Paenibacillus tuaregi]
MKKRFQLSLVVVVMLSILSACSSANSSSAVQAKNTIHVKIGVSGSEDPFWQTLKKKAKEKNIEIELISFSDYILPNQALANGEVDLNAFQHLAFLSKFNAENNQDIVPVGATVIAPMALYSKKYANVPEIPDGAKIAIPDDPSNQGRALKVLQAAGLITLPEDVGLFVTPEQIESNPKKIEIVPVTAQQTPRVLDDVAASVINSGVATDAGLKLDGAIFQDDPKSEQSKPYINVFAAQAKDKDNATFKTIVDLYHEADVEDEVKKDSKGANVVVDLSAVELQATLNKLVEDGKRAGK